LRDINPGLRHPNLSGCVRKITFRVRRFQRLFCVCQGTLCSGDINLIGALDGFCEHGHTILKTSANPRPLRNGVTGRWPIGDLAAPSSVISGAWPGRTPRYPFSPGIWTDSALSRTTIFSELRFRVGKRQSLVVRRWSLAGNPSSGFHAGPNSKLQSVEVLANDERQRPTAVLRCRFDFSAASSTSSMVLHVKRLLGDPSCLPSTISLKLFTVSATFT